MSAPLSSKTLAGTKPTAAKAISEPLSYSQLRQQIEQLQNTVNELIKRVNDLVTDYNAHTHTGVTVGAGSTGAKGSAAASAVTGTAQTATNLFTSS